MQEFFITLRAARIIRGLTLKQVAALTGKCSDTISKYEHDSTDIPRDLSVQLISLYGVPDRLIHFGKESSLYGSYEKVV